MFPETNIMSYFADMDDPRRGQNITHPLINIVTIAILGVICGADGWVDIERYGNAKKDWLSSFLDLEKGIPLHDSFGRVFRWLDETVFQECFVKWTASLCQQTGGDLVAMDGKKLRRSQERRKGRDGIWMVSAWSSENRLVLGQKKVDEKSNEITAIPELLAQLDITGCVVTLDALNTQTAIAKQIVDAKADYILAVKKNQGTLYEDLENLFAGFEYDHYQDVIYETAQSKNEGHDRQEFRQIWVVSEPEYQQYLRHGKLWASLKNLIKLVTVRVTANKTETTSRYFISSWQASAQDFMTAIREHWQIENGLHWVLDIAFREDESRIRKDHAPQNMAVLRHLALNLLKQETSVKVGIAARCKMAGWDNDYLGSGEFHG
ncbi:ISAs1 family transposase [Phototrophicus methaneseepsis]|uniref:ISAs1 family transposase n=1 Tax=Phototrophicus methaneseepsis TaxID=2710758 RepID=A0A7S8EA29_9CHLR|nr:ISAs1 family transposase [Phototrophicus methaneseepsis]QPC83141.1 ISAs1 family transposase [Phototrophicus methaneseepsis]